MAMFERPSEVVFGRESAERVAARIDGEVWRALSAERGANALLVTHGTAIVCSLRRHTSVDAFVLWRSLGLPAYVTFSVPAFGIVGSSGVDETLFAKLG